MNIKQYAESGRYDRYFFDYVKSIYNDLGFSDYIVAVYPKGYPHQHIKEKIFDNMFEASFIYCAGNVRGRDVVFYVEIDGDVTDEKIINAIYDKLHYTDCLIDIQIMDRLDNATKTYINRQINRHIKEAEKKHGKRFH